MTMDFKQIVLMLLIILLFNSSYASHKIKVMALFTDKAMLVIDGNRQILKKGQTSKEGVKLISSDSEMVLLELHGKQQKFKLGSEIATSFKQVEPGREVTIWKDEYNMFRTQGSIDNFSIKFLVDTGASSVALNSNQARRIGLKYKTGTPMHVSTASGIAKGYRVNLNKVKVGHIQLYNVEAIVLEGASPSEALLGQSFLGRIHMTRDGDQMKLKKNY